MRVLQLSTDILKLFAGIIQRILCYQKKNRIKINFEWRQLWSALFTVIKFLVNQEVSLLKKFDIFQLALQIINMVNLFITFGDTFLNTAVQYDELYYEIIRCQQTFESLYSLSKYFLHITKFHTHEHELPLFESHCTRNIFKIDFLFFSW